MHPSQQSRNMPQFTSAIRCKQGIANAKYIFLVGCCFYCGTSAFSCAPTVAFLGAPNHRNSQLWLRQTMAGQLDTTLESVIEHALRRVNITASVEVLSRDPLIYTIPGLLSIEECQAYRRYVLDIEGKNETENDLRLVRKESNRGSQVRTLTRSNPPAVLLDISRLWPLPILSLLAGVPPYARFLAQGNHDGGDSLNRMLSQQELLFNVVSNVGTALICMIALAWLVVLPLIRVVSDSTARTSVALALNEKVDVEFIQPLVHRACAAVSGVHEAFPWFQWEAPVVTKYDPGAVFAVHGDASPTLGSEWSDKGGQRVATVICYLNTLEHGQGGETRFDKLQIAVAPQAGTALVFFPADATSKKADDRTTHESLPPTTEKWIVQLFGRIERVPPPLGLPSAFDRVG
jgi:2OG-Fe(II) oxygenase superfamily